jgi:hypothetical protein
MLFRPTLYKTDLQILRYEITGFCSKKGHKQLSKSLHHTTNGEICRIGVRRLCLRVLLIAFNLQLKAG